MMNNSQPITHIWLQKACIASDYVNCQLKLMSYHFCLHSYLCSTDTLVHLPSNQLPDGHEWPNAFESPTLLSSSDKNYSQLEREALSLVFGVKKFHPYLYGKKFILITDHESLTIPWWPLDSNNGSFYYLFIIMTFSLNQQALMSMLMDCLTFLFHK